MSNIVIVNGINVIEELEKAQKELKELKRDVKRYFELRNHEDFPFAFGSELSVEVYRLRDKLMKVGKGE